MNLYAVSSKNSKTRFDVMRFIASIGKKYYTQNMNIGGNAHETIFQYG